MGSPTISQQKIMQAAGGNSRTSRTAYADGANDSDTAKRDGDYSNIWTNAEFDGACAAAGHRLGECSRRDLHGADRQSGSFIAAQPDSGGGPGRQSDASASR